MSNTSIGDASKGSKLAMQRLSRQENTHAIEKILGDKLEWISPLQSNYFREYSMNNPILLQLLGISQSLKRKYFDGFWPSRQPQWDGIAIGAERTLYLFEAKSHFSEITPGKKGNPVNNRIKYDSIMDIALKLFDIKNTQEYRETWCTTYYQISNRIVFQQRLLEISQSARVSYSDVKMIFLNFLNDRTWEAENKMVCSEEAWKKHYDGILSEMGIDSSQLEKKGIILVNLNFDDLK